MRSSDLKLGIMPASKCLGDYNTLDSECSFKNEWVSGICRKRGVCGNLYYVGIIHHKIFPGSE
jgi:hypothetical protein